MRLRIIPNIEKTKRNILVWTNLLRAVLSALMLFTMDSTVVFFVCLYLATLMMGGDAVVTSSMTAEIFDYQLLGKNRCQQHKRYRRCSYNRIHNSKHLFILYLINTIPRKNGAYTINYWTKVAFIGVTYAFLMIFQALYSQAFTSLAQVLTPNGDERTSLLSVSMFINYLFFCTLKGNEAENYT